MLKCALPELLSKDFAGITRRYHVGSRLRGRERHSLVFLAGAKKIPGDFTESSNGWGWKSPLGPSGLTSPQAGTPTASCPGPCPGGFWRSTRRGLHNNSGLSHLHRKEMLLQKVYLSILEKKLILLTEEAFCSDFVLSLHFTPDNHSCCCEFCTEFSFSCFWDASSIKIRPCIVTRSTEQPIWTCKHRTRHKAVATRWSLCIIFTLKFRYGAWSL